MDKIFSLLQALGVALSLHLTESSNPHQDDKTFQGGSTPDETFKNAALPLTHMQQYLGKYLPEAATVPFSGVDQIITEAMRARIPNFGQPSGITQALNQREQGKQREDSQ